MKETLVPIDQAGRIVLPKTIRDELAIQPGDTFKVSVSGTTVTLHPNQAKAGLIRKGKALVFCSGGNTTLHQQTVDEIVALGREERLGSVRSGLADRKARR